MSNLLNLICCTYFEQNMLVFSRKFLNQKEVEQDSTLESKICLPPALHLYFLLEHLIRPDMDDGLQNMIFWTHLHRNTKNANNLKKTLKV